jgi:glycerol-3-phosphate dehydrogenase
MLDVIIIGSGIIGTSIAREIARYQANVLVIDKETDVACGTTKANSGIVHAGFDAESGSLKAKFNVIGNKMFDDLARELDFPFKRNGAMVLAFDAEQEKVLENLYQKGQVNGVEGLEIISGDEARRREPQISPAVTKALYAPTSGIVSPYEMAIAYAENAAANGVGFQFNAEVKKIEKLADGFRIITANNAYYETKAVINCAGVYADDLNNQVSEHKLQIIARKGEYFLFDKSNTDYTATTLFQTPSKMGKGVLVTPATHGNIIIGPTAKDVDDKDELATTVEGLQETWEKATKTMPSLNRKAIITAFSGLRAHSVTNDFIISFADVPGFYNVAGIESPGLSCAPAIAVHVSKEVAEYLRLEAKPDFIGTRKAIPHFAVLPDEKKAELIRENPLFGKIVCRCEVVTEAEIREAIARGATDLDGIKRRTRAGMGRCQAGFCTPRIMEILAQELKIDLTEITKNGRKSRVLIGRVKE